MSDDPTPKAKCQACRKRNATRCIRDPQLHRHVCGPCGDELRKRLVSERRYRSVDSDVDACGLVERIRGVAIPPLARTR